MSTLAEIEAALPALTTAELEQLAAVVREAKSKRTEHPPRPTTDLAMFSGLLSLPEDPLAWQRQIREEWG